MAASKLYLTVDLITEYHRELTLFSCEGLDRDSYDTYDAKTDTYKLHINPEDYDPADPTHLLTHECELCPGRNEAKEIERQGLIKLEGKLYFPEQLLSNINSDNRVYESLTCYNFTSTVASLLQFSNGKGQQLSTRQAETSGYCYVCTSPVSNEDRLSLLFNKDGIYVCQLRFQNEDHAFIVILDGQLMTVLNLHSALQVVKHNLAAGLGCLLLLERNQSGNKALFKQLLGTSLYYPSDYMIMGLMQCDYWAEGVDAEDVANFFAHISKVAFKGREEAGDIKKLVKKIRLR